MPLLPFDQTAEVLTRHRLGPYPADVFATAMPRRVMQFWDREPPDQIQQLLARNRSLCAQAGAEYLLFDAGQARDFIQAHGTPLHLQAYDIAEHPAMKCDVFRLCYLARRGGFYVDADLVLRPNLAELLAMPGDLLVFQWDKQNLSNLCNWLIGACAGQATLEATLEATAHSIVSACTADSKLALKNILNVSGPGIFTRAVATHLAQHEGSPAVKGVNIQTVSRAHQLIELGPAFLAAPLDYKNNLNDKRHWRTAGEADAAPTAEAPAETVTAASGLKGMLAGWLGGTKRQAPVESRPASPAAAAPVAPAPQAATKPLAATLRDHGQRNRIDLHDGATGQLSVIINGHDNRVRVAAGCKLQNLRIDIRGDHCEIDIGELCVLAGEFICRDHRTRLLVGSKTTMMGSKITMHESGLIRIGEDCMFAGDIRMDTSDMHSIIDVASGERINPPGDIDIGPHVWLGYGTYVLKGVRIGADCIVGACAVVADDLPPNSLAVGMPARVVRSGVSWDRRRLPMPPGRRD